MNSILLTLYLLVWSLLLNKLLDFSDLAFTTSLLLSGVNISLQFQQVVEYPGFFQCLKASDKSMKRNKFLP